MPLLSNKCQICLHGASLSYKSTVYCDNNLKPCLRWSESCIVRYSCAHMSVHSHDDDLLTIFVTSQQNIVHETDPLNYIVDNHRISVSRLGVIVARHLLSGTYTIKDWNTHKSILSTDKDNVKYKSILNNSLCSLNQLLLNHFKHIIARIWGKNCSGCQKWRSVLILLWDKALKHM